MQADVGWHFMGTDWKKEKKWITIHEYASGSVPPFSRLKNFLKKQVNITPDFRIFNNQFVRDCFQFTDGVSSAIREYAVIPPGPELPEAGEKRYDFVYLGTVGKERELAPLFRCFRTGSLKDRSLLVISQHYGNLARQLRSSSNIHFIGPVPYMAVRHYLRQCRFGINFIPDRVPFNRQISAKLLDYSAASLPVVSTDYEWVRNFGGLSGGHFFYINRDLSNFTWEEVIRFAYRLPDLREWTWENQIRKSGILEFLESRFGNLNFNVGSHLQKGH